VVAQRSGAGSIPASLRISQTVETATLTPAQDLSGRYQEPHPPQHRALLPTSRRSSTAI